MVVIVLPATALTGSEQERIATPSTWTVQAPHWAMPQPYLVPVMPMVSRNTQSKGVESSTSALWDWPLMDSEIILNPPVPSLSTRRKMSGAGGAGFCWDTEPRDGHHSLTHTRMRNRK